MNDQPKIKVYIVEDDPDIRSAFSLIIDQSTKFKVIGAFESFEESLKGFAAEIPDVVMMDIQLPGISGIEATRIVREKYPTVEVVIVTVFEDDEMVFEALKAGASGYITKGSNYLELINALEEIVKGGAPMSSRIARMVIHNYHVNLNSPLTKRERQILQMVAGGKTYTMIGEELNISKETSKTHIRNIYAKLHVHSKSGAIAKANADRLI